MSKSNQPASDPIEGKEAAQPRIRSLDQFRGYTILGMLLVNFAGAFAAMPDTIRHHHTHVSYADTIMPQFLFAVGFALRLTWLRRCEQDGPWPAFRRSLLRVGALLFLGVVYHGLAGGVKSWAELEQLGFWGFLRTAFQREPFETLTHIAVTSLWVLPVLAARPAIRIGYAILSAGLFWYLSQRCGYYTWVVTRPGIDGGPLGFLTWTIPLLAGTIAFDALRAGASLAVIVRLFLGGLVLMTLGYGLSCLSRVLDAEATSSLAAPPFVAPAIPKKDYHLLSQKPENAPHLFWVMSQRAGSPSYLVFGAGFSLALYAAFVLVCDVWGWANSVLDTFGANALAAYIVHDMVANTLRKYKPADAPLWFALVLVGVYFVVCYLILRYLQRHRLFLRL